MFRYENKLTGVIPHGRILGVLALTLGRVVLGQSHTLPPIFDPPKGCYLGLGDSIACGFPASKFVAGLPPSGCNTGYVDIFAARLREIRPGITTINDSCPGESTESFVNGGCIWTKAGLQLHDSYRGTQLQVELAFRRAHPGQVSPITLRLAGNDLPRLLGPCTFNGRIDLNCV